MGGYGSKDNVVADSIDNSTNLSKEYAMLRLHGWGRGYRGSHLHLLQTLLLETRQDEPCQAKGSPG
jgi:hypothetical protein